MVQRCCRGVGGSSPPQRGALSHPCDRAPPTLTAMALPALIPPPSLPSQARCWWPWWWWCSSASLVLVVGGARAQPLAAGSHLVTRNRPVQASTPMLQCMFQLFQTFQRHVAIVSYGCCKSRSGHVASISEACCKHLFKMFYLFPDVCCNRFDLDVAYVFTHMLQQYIPKCFICSSLMLQQVFSCCKLQVF